MRRMEMMTAAGVTLAGLGALVALAIGSGDGVRKLAVQRTQPVEVRTEVIRKTVNVYRRERPHRVGGSGPGGSSPGGSAAGPSGPASTATRTRSSGARPVAPAAPVVTTRSSGSRSSSGSPSAPSRSQTVRTRSSGGGGGRRSGSSRLVSTRSSGGGGERDGGHDD